MSTCSASRLLPALLRRSVTRYNGSVRGWSPKIKRDPEAGSSLLELLFVTLIIGLIAAAVLPKILDFLKPSEESAAAAGANLEAALIRWLGDPEEAASGAVNEPFGSDEDRRAYETMVRDLESADRLEEWKRILESRLSKDHPLLVALTAEDPQKGLSAESGSVLIRSARDGQDGTSDPDMVWSDGAPVTAPVERKAP